MAVRTRSLLLNGSIAASVLCCAFPSFCRWCARSILFLLVWVRVYLCVVHVVHWNPFNVMSPVVPPIYVCAHGIRHWIDVEPMSFGIADVVRVVVLPAGRHHHCALVPSSFGRAFHCRHLSKSPCRTQRPRKQAKCNAAARLSSTSESVMYSMVSM